MPWRGTSCGAQRARSIPSNSTVPRLRGARPMIARKVVVLPTPLRPSSAAHSPSRTSRFTPWRMCSFPIWTWTSSSLSMASFLDVVLVLLATEIRPAHARVGGNLVRTAGCEDRALRHHRDIVGNPEDNLHIVLDDDDVDHPRELADFCNGTLGLPGAHPAGRLVEQKQRWLRVQRHADLKERHIAVGQRAGLSLRERSEPGLLESALDLLARATIFCGGA